METDLLNLTNEKDTPRKAAAMQNEPTSITTMAYAPRREATNVKYLLKSTAL